MGGIPNRSRLQVAVIVLLMGIICVTLCASVALDANGSDGRKCSDAERTRRCSFFLSSQVEGNWTDLVPEWGTWGGRRVPITDFWTEDISEQNSVSYFPTSVGKAEVFASWSSTGKVLQRILALTVSGVYTSPTGPLFVYHKNRENLENGLIFNDELFHFNCDFNTECLIYRTFEYTDIFRTLRAFSVFSAYNQLCQDIQQTCGNLTSWPISGSCANALNGKPDIVLDPNGNTLVDPSDGNNCKLFRLTSIHSGLKNGIDLRPAFCPMFGDPIEGVSGCWKGNRPDYPANPTPADLKFNQRHP